MTSILDSINNKRKRLEAAFEPFCAVIEEVGEGREGRYKDCTFEGLMKSEWFSNTSVH